MTTRTTLGPVLALALLAALAMALGTVGTLSAGGLPQSGDGSPDQEPITRVELGRLLFWDPLLSGPQDVACGTCHHPDFAYADGRALSLGTGAVGIGPDRVDRSGGRIPVMRRNSPTVLNTAYNGARRRRRDASFDGTAAVDQARAPMFWDRRVRSLETQALLPLETFEEMRGETYPEAVAVDSVVARLAGIPEYGTLFQEAFGPGPDGHPVDAPRLAQALAEFQRSLVAMQSPFDRFRAGDSTALTPQQRRGEQLFDRVGCDRCHGGPMFSDFGLHAEGVAEHPLLAAPDTGDGRFRFRTPALRNVALTAPYMHNGTLATLADVLRFYDEGRSRNPAVPEGRGRRGDRGPRLDGQFQRVRDMSEGEMADIVAFLEALSDPAFDRTVPERVPSGLPPGGAIGGGTLPRSP